MTSFPTLEGNQISSDEQEQQQEDSDTYIGVALRLHLLEQGGVSFLTYNMHIVWSAGCSNASQHTKDGMGITIWFPHFMGISAQFQTLEGNQISSDEQEQQDSDTYIGVAFGST